MLFFLFTDGLIVLHGDNALINIPIVYLLTMIIHWDCTLRTNHPFFSVPVPIIVRTIGEQCSPIMSSCRSIKYPERFVPHFAFTQLTWLDFETIPDQI